MIQHIWAILPSPATTFITSHVCFGGYLDPLLMIADLYDIWYFFIWGFDLSGFFGFRFFRHMYVGTGPFKEGASIICWGILDPLLWVLPGYGSLWKWIYLYLKFWRVRTFWIQIFLTHVYGSRTHMKMSEIMDTPTLKGPGPTYICRKNVDP